MHKYRSYYIEQNRNYRNLQAHGIEKEEVAHFKYDINDEYEKRSPLVIECMGTSYPDPNYEIVRKPDIVYVLEYVTSGVGYIEIDGSKYTVKEGDCYILEAGKRHHYWSDEKNPYGKVWVNFHGSMFNELLKAYHLNGIYHFPHCDIYPQMKKIHMLENISLYSNEVFPEFLKIINEILSIIYCSHNRLYHDVPVAIMDIKQTIDRSIHDQISIEDLAKRFGKSPNWIMGSFKKQFGKSVKQYVLESKIELAKELLKNTNNSISDIADDLSFYDSFAFSNAFKKQTGMSPRRYRESLLTK